MAEQMKHVAITYLTHRWVMAGIAAWVVLIAGPQLVAPVVTGMAPSDALPMLMGVLSMPIFFLSIMLVPQVKAQFAHPRARLVPRFALPHLAVIVGLLVALLVLYPLIVAVCLRLDAIGVVVLSFAIAAPGVLGLHFNRFSGMLVSIGVFYSTISSAGATWWILEADSHRTIHAAILLAAVATLALWLWRLCHLWEEHDDYQTTVHWPTARKSGVEVSEQRRILADHFRRHKTLSWLNDAWHARLGGFHRRTLTGIARLLRYGFGAPVEIQAVWMSGMFFAITLFIAEFGFGGQSNTGFGAIQMYLIMAAMFPGMMAGEQLAQRRPRIAVELTLPLSRTRLVDGLFAATAWNATVFWFGMAAGLLLAAWRLLGQQFTGSTIAMLLLMTASGALAMVGVSLRVSVWPSRIKRLAVMMAAMFAIAMPILVWTYGRANVGDAPFVLVAAILVAIGAAFITRARRAWLNLELG
jgi:hypothetical protein